MGARRDDGETYATTGGGSQDAEDARLPMTAEEAAQEYHDLPEHQFDEPPGLGSMTPDEHIAAGDEAAAMIPFCKRRQKWDRMAAFAGEATMHYAAATAKRGRQR
jgi:hypothetical protein